MVMIDVEVIDAQLDCNILLGNSYMYAIKEVTASILCIMMLSFNGKVVSLDQNRGIKILFPHRGIFMTNFSN